MPISFKEYYNYGDTLNHEDGKWNVILFTGDYNPITRIEFMRIKGYINEVVTPDKSRKFSKDIDIGLLAEKNEQTIDNDVKINLSLEERQFITGKLFGLKLFPIDFNDLFNLAKIGARDKMNKEVSKYANFLKEKFENANILIVLRPNEQIILNEKNTIIDAFRDNDVKIGLTIFDYNFKTPSQYFGSMPINGNMIKACCLLDNERPDPKALKVFSSKYSILENLDYIKVMHFKTKNENYDLAFTYLFPDIIVTGSKVEDKVTNTKLVMEMIKSMYINKI